MKTYFYPIAVTIAIWISVSPWIQAQSNLGQKKFEFGVSTEASNLEEVKVKMNMPPKPALSQNFNRSIPHVDEIHSEIRWYALENAANDQYWESVDQSRLWIEFELGASLQEPQIAAFLETFNLDKVLRESQFKDLTNFWIFDLPNASREDVLEIINAATQIEGILFAEPSAIYKKHYTPNDPLYQQQWGPFVTSFDQAWDQGIGGNSWNVVAVIDDACDWLHEDLYDQVWYGYDYANFDFDITPDIAEDTHGTHTTGTVAATIGNGIGVAGMVNDTVYFAKVGTGDGGLSDAGIVEAVYDIASIERVMAVNMSLGADAPNAAMEQACNFAWNSGQLLIVASGNNGQSVIGFPAAYSSCVAVGSIGADGEQLYLTGYSQNGNEQELVAPGGDLNTGFGIMSCLPNNQYGAEEGTSMAAPHVTGLAGLMKNLNEDLTNSDIRNILVSTAFDFGEEGWDAYFGYGMINAAGAVAVALGEPLSTAQLDGESAFKIYPNPATHRLFVDIKIETNEAVLEIFDITGKQVRSIPVNQLNRTEIDIQSLNSGIYILRMRTEKGIASSRFVKT